jgi:hypothetical protein
MRWDAISGTHALPQGQVRDGSGRLRKRAGISQKRFVDAIGGHRTTMGTIEQGAPCLDTIMKIAGGPGITVPRSRWKKRVALGGRSA